MKYANRAKETTTATSTSTVTVLGAVTKYRAFSSAFTIGTTNIPLMIEDELGNWLEGEFTLTNATLLTRTSILDSSANGADVTFPAGTKSVFCAVPASQLAKIPAANDTTVSTIADGAVTSMFIETAGVPARITVNDFMTANGATAGSLDPAGTLSGADVITVTQGGVDKRTTLTAIAAAVASINGGGAATVSGVTVSPSTASLAGGGTQTFTATVAGTNSPAQTVTWTTTLGSITTGGVLTAPAATGSSQTVIVTATSTVDGTKSGTATVTVAAASATVSSVAVSPTTPTVTGGATQQFTATVTGTGSPAQSVTWSTNLGTINSSGLFTAPAATGSVQTATITATSTQDNTKSGTTTVTIPVAAVATVSSVTVSPSTANVNGAATQQFTATVAGTNSPAQTVTWTANVGSITTGGLFTAPASTGSAQTVTITATSTVDNTKSGTATVTVPATVAPTYTITGYSSNTMRSTIDASAIGLSGSLKGITPNAQSSATSPYWDINPTPASAKGGWGTSNTVAPAEITSGQNIAGGSSINGMTPMSKAAGTYTWSLNAYLWVTSGSGSTGPYYFWIKPVDGVAYCVNPGAGTMVTGA